MLETTLIAVEAQEWMKCSPFPEEWNVEPMADEQGETIPAGFLNLITRLSERVATVEAGQIALKDDTKVIRSTMHEHANYMQAFALQEEKCANGINNLSTATTSLGATVLDLTTKVGSLITTRDQASGAWWGLGRFAIVAVAIAGLIGWLLTHNVQIVSH